MTKLIFRYSSIYDHNLATLSKSALVCDERASHEYVQRYQSYWQQFNDIAITYYREMGLVLPDYWLGYFIHPVTGLSSFSDPLTLVMKEDFEEVTATLLHELGHIFLTLQDNNEVYQKLSTHIEEKYADESWTTRIHLMVNILAGYGLHQLYSPQQVNALLAKEKHYIGLERAWEIIDTHLDVFQRKSPIAAILSL